MTKKDCGKALCCAAALCVAACGASEKGLYGDTPDARHAWAVHDMNRPYPKYVKVQPGTPPSDAVVLFDGTQASVDANWCDPNGQPTKWTVKDGAFVCTPRSGAACTKRPFGDAQFHVEWCAPVPPEEKPGERKLSGNSGVFPMGMYEIQILNSYDPDPAADIRRNYPDGLAAAVYAENPPLVNVCLPPGEWQSFDIVFHQPVWEGDRLVHPGSVTVFQNGVLVQDHWEMEGLTTHRVRRPLAPHETKLPWRLQDHSNPVQFRNIWIREIPSRTANTTHGGPYAREADVKALREQTAARLFAQVDAARASTADVKLALETLAYSTDAKYVEAAKKTCANWKARTDALPPSEKKQAAADLKEIKKSFDVFTRCKVLDLAGFPLAN